MTQNTNNATNVSFNNAQSVVVNEIIKRKRGRPRKHPVQDEASIVKRKRGRPSKNAAQTATLESVQPVNV